MGPGWAGSGTARAPGPRSMLSQRLHDSARPGRSRGGGGAKACWRAAERCSGVMRAQRDMRDWAVASCSGVQALARRAKAFHLRRWWASIPSKSLASGDSAKRSLGDNSAHIGAGAKSLPKGASGGGGSRQGWGCALAPALAGPGAAWANPAARRKNKADAARRDGVFMADLQLGGGWGNGRSTPAGGKWLTGQAMENFSAGVDG